MARTHCRHRFKMSNQIQGVIVFDVLRFCIACAKQGHAGFFWGHLNLMSFLAFSRRLLTVDRRA